MYRTSMGERVFHVANVVILFLLTFVTFYPIWYVFVASISVPERVASYTGMLVLPLGLSSETYRTVFQHPILLRTYANTVFYVVLGTAINFVMTVLGAYVLSRPNLYFKKYMMIMITITMFFSGGLIPSYLLINWLGLLNTVWALVLPGAMSTWNTIMMRTYFMGLPPNLEESARIDGASEWLVLFRIVLPLSAPIIAVILLYYGVGHWNSWFSAMIYLRDRTKYPIQLILREILIMGNMTELVNDTAYGSWRAVEVTLKYATIIVATVPILCVYPFLQKYFTKGILVGALKG